MRLIPRSESTGKMLPQEKFTFITLTSYFLKITKYIRVKSKKADTITPATTKV